MKERPSSIGSPKYIRLVPAMVLLLSLLLTFAVTSYLSRSNHAKNLTHFRTLTTQAQDNIRDHLEAFTTLLRGTAALFAASEDVTRGEFHAYVERLMLPQFYRGIQGIGFARRITRGERDSFVQKVRQEGLTNFTVFPEGERDEYFPVHYLEPQDRRNLKAIGYDMFSDSTRKAAMAAAKTNGIAASTKVTLVQEIAPPKQAGFLIYVGVYRGGRVPTTVTEREKELIGFVYSPFRADDFFEAIFSPERNMSVHLKIYDGDRVEEPNLLHQSINAASSNPLFSSTNVIQVAQHSWTIVSQTTPQFESTLQRWLVPGILAAGSLISLTLFGITTYLVQAREMKLRSEEALRSSEELYRTTTENAPEAIIIIDAESIILSVNSSTERIFGHPKGQLVGQHLTFLMPERMRQRHRAGLARYLGTGTRNIPWEGVELPGLHKDGHEIPLEISFAETFKDGKRVFAGIARDITERKRAESSLRDSEERYRALSEELENRVRVRTQELAASNQELEAFTYSVAHDLRAPLRHINAFAQLVEGDHQSELTPGIRNYVKRMSESASKMASLVDGLLNLALLDKTELLRQPVSLRPLAEEAASLLKDETEGRQIEWKIGELPSAECDPILIRQVFTNLLSNAIKYTRRRQTASIEVGKTIIKDQIAVFIRDNGVGFDMQYLGKLFGVFQRLHLAEEFEGTGVGLAMVSRIIQKHRGQVWAEAEEKKGATFYFTFPGMK